VPDRDIRAVAVGLDSISTRQLRAALVDALAGGPAALPLPTGPAAAVAELRAAVAPERGLPADTAFADTAVVLATSGSTGTAKGVALSAAALRASAGATLDRLGGPGDWVLALPAHHVAGLQVIVRAAISDRHVATVDGAGGFSPAAFVAAGAALPPGGRRYTSLVPTQLRRVLDEGGPALDALRGFDAVLVGGAATDPALRERATTAGVRLATTYGMTETCGGCVYDGVPLDGAEVAIDGPAGDVGTVRLRGSMLATGYLRAPALTAEAFAGGWFETRDLGRIDGRGRLDVLGRADDVIISGGENVAPVLVERALATVAGIADSCVVGIPDEQWGQAVCALLVAADPADPPALAGIRAALREQLGRHAVPKRFAYAAAIPTLASGKPDRTGVRRLLASSAQ
jgi:o-succinylbenzoate---CoA ligase